MADYVEVTNASELEMATKDKVSEIRICGELGRQMAKKEKSKKRAKKGAAIAAGVGVVASGVATVLTGGLAAPASIASATAFSAVATTAAGTTIALSTAEVGMLIAGITGISCYAISQITKHYKVVEVDMNQGNVLLRLKNQE